MSATASPRTTFPARRPALLRWYVDWPPTVEKMSDAMWLPPGFQKEISEGRLRIASPGSRVDRELLDLAEQLDRELHRYGLRFEIYAGRIVYSGVVRIPHWRVAAELSRQVRPVVEAHGWVNFPRAAVTIPHLREYVLPDVMLVRPDGPTFDEAFCGAAVPLAAEITSPGNAADDYGYKRRHYGMAGVAVYLIVDLQREEVVLHTGPHDEGYRNMMTVPFGTALDLPAPLDITLDTGAFANPG